MRTWLIIISICLFLAAVSVTEIYAVGNFCEDIENSVSRICELAPAGEVKEEDVDDLSSIWEKNKDFVFILSNHNAFSDYDKLISDMYYYYNRGDNEHLYHCAVNLENTNERLKFSTQCSLGNIF